MFAHFVAEQADVLRAISWITGPLKFGDYEPMIEQSEIDTVMHVANQPAAQSWSRLVVGARVRVRLHDGVSVDGVLAKVDAAEYCVVNVPMLGRSVAAPVAREQVELIR